jgi:hypothetical protein
MAQHYKDLIGWQRAMDLVAELYDATEAFPQARNLQFDQSDAPGSNLGPEQHC